LKINSSVLVTFDSIQNPPCQRIHRPSVCYLVKLFRNIVFGSAMSLSYSGKCDKCGKIRPDILIEVHKERGDGVLTPMIWCLECLRRG